MVSILKNYLVSQRKKNLFFLFIILISTTTMQASHNQDASASLIHKFFNFYENLTDEEKKIIDTKGFNKYLKDENNRLDQALANSLNKQYRNLTIAIIEGLTISVLLYYLHKFFHHNKFHKTIENNLPEVQKTVYLKKVVSKLHEIEKEIPKNSTISLLVNQIYNEQLAPEDALFKHNYSTFTKETNKYTDKLNSIQQKLEECHKLHHDNDTIKNCLKEISSMPKEPVQSFFQSKIGIKNELSK